MARRMPRRNALQALSSCLLCAVAGLAGESTPDSRGDTPSLAALSDTQRSSLLHLLGEACPADRERLLSAWSLAGAEVLDVFLQFAESELSAGRAESWPVLLAYFHGMLDRKVDLVVLRVLDVDVTDQTKVDALTLLNRHLMQESWILCADIRGEKVELRGMRGGGSLAWGPIVKEGRFVSVEDVHRIRDRVRTLSEDARESPRVRQHASELLAFIVFKDAQDGERLRNRVRWLRGEFYHLGAEAAERWQKEHSRVAQGMREKWEEERAKTQALESKGSGAESPQALRNGGGHTWSRAVIGFAGGMILGAVGSWLVLRRRQHPERE